MEKCISTQYLKQSVAALVVGFIFAIGLGISGMTEPSNVIGFLRVVQDWNPALIFVMLGAIPVHMLAYRFIKGKSHPIFDQKFHVPTSQIIDKNLVLGAVLFGIGWGIAGYCPGPAITSVTSGDSRVVIFLVAMTLGMFLKKK